MSAMSLKCGLCMQEKPGGARYTCPRCSIQYCSLDCYRSPSHLDCSEGFFRQCVEEELASQSPNQNPTSMADILRRMSDEREPEVLDSDDESSDGEDLATRLGDVHLASSDFPARDVWSRLRDQERQEFLSLVESGDIMKFVPTYQPWWGCATNELVQEFNPKEETPSQVPPIKQDIPPLAQLMARKPSEKVVYGLLNVIYAYCVVVRLYMHDWEENAQSAVHLLLAISANLGANANFATAVEAVDHGRVSAGERGISSDLCSEVSKCDVKRIIERPVFILASLSDTLSLLERSAVFLPPAERKRVSGAVKKIHFYLSYVKDYGGHITSTSGLAM